MKVRTMGADRKTPNPDRTTQRDEGPTARSEPAASQPQPSGVYRVVIPAVAREIEEIRKLLDATPDVRSEKVEAVRKSLETNRYDIRPEQVADRMIGGAIVRNAE